MKLLRAESITAKRTTIRRALYKNLNLESLETRALMANNFLAGTAFIDANSNGQLDTTETYLAGAAIELRSSVGTLLQTATTDAKGAYLFSGLSPGNYKLINLSAGGFAPTSTQALSRISPVTGSTSNSIDVTLADPAGLQASIDITAFGSSGLFRNMNYSLFGTTVGGSGGQLPVKLHSSTFTPNPTSAFLSLCVDLYNDLGTGLNGPYVVTPDSVPIGNGAPHNAERVAYLYNHYGQAPQGSNGAAALQIAVWELLYDANSSDPDGLSGNLAAGNFRINSVTPSVAVLAQANLLLAESVGKAESAIFLNVPPPTPGTPGTVTRRQGVIVTGSFNFGNQIEAKIGDYVWLDQNANGQQDGTEQGIDGLTVKLLDATGTTVLLTTTTGDNPNLAGTQQGYYEFKGLAPGSYVVQFFTGAGYSAFTTLDVGADTSDSDANPLTGKTAIYTLISGQFNQTVDAGLKPIDLSLTKSVSNSTPAVGDNVTFTLTVNNANGFSTATGVIVTDVMPAGLTFLNATPSQGSFSGNLWTIGTLTAGQTVTLAVTAAVATGGTKTNYAEVSAADQLDLDSTPNNTSNNEDDDDQVSLTPTAAIGDYVWLDRNADGQQDSGEPGIDGLMVQLLDATGTTVLFTTATGDNPNLAGTQQGYYEFKGLTPGSYVVQFFTGGGYNTFTTLDVGADATDSDANVTTGKTAVYTLASGDFNQTVDAGLRPIDLSLTKSVSNSAPAVGENVAFTVSVNNANGFSTATGVKVNDVLPAGLTLVSAIPSQGTYSGNTWTIGTLNAGQTVTLVVTATVATGGTKTNYAEVTAADQVDTDSTPNNNSTNEDDDDQVSLTPTAAIGDYVWLDRNANGQQDVTESGIDGLMVKLLDAAGTTVLFTTTTGDNPNLAGTQQGYYEFKGLTPGSYVVQFFTGAGYDTFTSLDVGADATDSDANVANGKTAVYTLASGDFNQTVDAGLKPIDLSLTKSVNNSAPAVGDNVIFTISVNNANGFSTATGVKVNDVLPAGLAFVSAVPSQGTYVGNIWTIGTLNAGQTVTLTVTANVTTGGTKTNYAEVTAADQVDTDSTPNNNSNNEDDDDQASLTPTAAIGDYVWLDRNADGQQDSGEPGLDGLTVKLLDAAGTTVLFTTTTGDNPNLAGTQQGYYEFKGLTPGSYVVQFFTSAGYDTFTTLDVGADATDSDANVTTGKTFAYALASGDFNQTVDAGLKPIDLSLTKTVSNSAPAVGDNVIFTITVNNANGFSTATGVTVNDALPAGLTLLSATPSQGSFAGNVWTIGTLIAGQTETLTITATVATGGIKTNYAEVSAANQLDIDSTPNNNSTNEDDDDQVSLNPTAAIGDYVWLDRNADGQQNSGEPGIDGLTVKLLDATGTTVLFTTTTGDDPNVAGTQQGYYEFKGLTAGSYVVQFFTGAGYSTFTTLDVGNDATDSDADVTTGKTAVYTLASGDFNQTVDAGLKPIDLSLTKSVSNNAPAVGENVIFTVTVNNANGFSTATGVEVKDVLPLGLTFVSATPSQGSYSGNTWTIGTLTAGQTVTLAVTATVTSGGTKTNYAEVTAANQVDTDSTPNNNSNNEDDDDQVSLTPTAAIGDYVWLDRNANGQQDSGEPGLDGLTVKLLDATGTTVLSTTTTGDNPNLAGTQQGYYEFKGLTPGSYVVQFFTGAGYSAFTLLDVSPDATDSDADLLTGKTTVYTLASGEFNQTVDAGLRPIDLSLTKTVSNSAPAVGDNVIFTITVNNANGFSTATGVKVTDVLPAGLTFLNATVSQGSFSGNLWTIGTLTAGQTVTLAVTATVATGGTKTNYAEVSAADQLDLDSTPNNTSNNEDDDDQVSLTPTAAIGDYVWLDRNANGQQDSGEPGIDGLMVQLLDATGTTVLFTTATGDNPNLAGTQQGYYEFKGQTPGSYVVQFFTGGGYNTFTNLDVGADATDSDANVTTGKTAVYALASGDFNQTVDAGLKPIDLSLTKSVSNSAPAVGDNVAFTVSVNNANGFSTATGVQVKDVLPLGLTLVSAIPSQGTYSGNTWTIGMLAAGQTVTLVVTATVTSGGTKTNYAEVTAADQVDTDSTPNNNSNNEDDDDQASLTPTAAIGDYVWLDRNANGQQDVTESGIDGLMVKLLDAAGTTVLFTTTTGDNPNLAGTQQGYYEFKGLTPGSYVVQFFTGAGYGTFTTLDVGADATDSDANVTTGKTIAYTLNSGDFNQTVDAGLKPIDLSLTKTVNNSAPAVGDDVIFTITVNNANGFSTATGVKVNDVLPAGLTFFSAVPSQGTYAGNSWMIGTLTAGQTVTLTVTATVTTGGTKTNYAEVTAADQFDTDSTPNNNSTNEDDDDQASLTPTAAIGDYVWLDRDADGQQGVVEPGLDGLMVKLLDATGTTVLFTTTTGDNPNLAGTQQGYYEFKGLTPGSYVVQFFTGGGYDTFTTLDVGADATDSDANVTTGKTIAYTLNSGDFNQTVDAGLKPIDLSLTKTVSNSAPAVGDNVTFTVTVNNANGFSTATGVTVNDALPSGLTFSSATPSQGSFSGNIWTIGTLNPGQTVTLTITANVSTGGTKTNYAEVTAADQVDTDSTPNNNSSDEDDDDQVSLTPTVAIGDYVWLDRNADGQQSVGEVGIDGLTVKLLDSTGTTVLFTTTTGDNPNLAGTQQGYYEFKGLTPGSYVVQFFTGGGYDTFTTLDVGADATDSDANVTTGKTIAYTLNSGDFNQTVDAGLKPIDLSLTKTVSNAAPAVNSNVTFTLTVNNANGFSTATGVTVTDALPAGLTFVNATPSQGSFASNVWSIGTLNPGQTVTLTITATVTSGGTKTNYAEVSAANQLDIDSTPNNSSNNEDDDEQVSLTPTAAIGDYVWLDRNADGQQSVGEVGIDGLTVKLLDSTGTTVLFTTTTGDNPNLAGTQQGYYEFKGLTPGSYVVQFFTGGGYDTFTTLDVGADATDSDANVTTGKTVAYTLNSGDFNQTVDAGLKPIDLSLTKTVSNSAPAVGDNVTFTLTVNNANGFSTATGVTVTDALPAGLTFVNATPSQGSFAGNVWTIGTLTAGQTVTLTITANVASGGTKTNYAEVSAANQLDIDSTPNNNSNNEDDDDQVSLGATAAIGDYVWLDRNADGQQSVGEVGIDGLTVKLLNATGTTVLFTTTTGDNPNLAGTQQGYYEFKGLTPGSYVVQFFTGGGYDTFTTLDVGADATDSDANVTTGKTIAYTLNSGDFNQTVDAGLKPIDLSLTKTVNNTTPTVGSNVSFTVTVTNANGFSTATGVTVKDVLPAGLSFVSATFSDVTDTFAGNIWTIGTLAAGQSATLTIAATVTSGGAITNFAQVQAAGQIDTDSTPGNNTDGTPSEDDEGRVTITPSGIVIKKYVNEVISVGGEGLTPGFWKQTQHYYAWTAPYSPLTSPPVGFVNNYNSVFGLTAVQSDPTLTLLGAMERGGGGANALGRHAVAALLNAANTNVSYLYSTSQIISMVQNAYATNNFDPTKNLFEAQNQLGADLTPGGSTSAQGPLIDADTAPGLVLPTNAQIAFTFIVTNTGSVSLSNVIVTDNKQTPADPLDDFNPSPVLVTFSSQQFNTGDTDHDNLLDPGEQWQYKHGPIFVIEGLHTNIATVVGTPVGGSGQVTDDDPANWKGVSENLIDLSVTKSVSNASPQIGSNVNYTVIVNNAVGFVTATGVRVQDLLPAGLTYVSYTATAGTSYNNVSGDWNVGTLVSGGSATLTITATVTTGGTKTNYAEVSAAGQLDIDSIPNNNSTTEDDDDQVTIIPSAQLNAKIDIEKTTNGTPNANPVAPDYDNEDAANGVGVPVLTVGNAVTWSYKVTNTGNVTFATSDIVIVDDNGTPSISSDDMSIANGKITFLSVSVGDADNLLEAGEVWLYKANGTVQTVLIPGTGASTTIDFQGNTALDGTDGNIMTFSSGGVSVKASAFSRTDAGVWSPAYLGSYGGGLGVTDALDGTGANDTHTVDNMGGSDNYVLFEFSQSVIVDSALLGYVVGDSDMTVWIGTKSDPFNNHITLSDAMLSSLGFTEVNLGGSATRLADINASNLAGNVLVIASKVDETVNDDRFKIQNVVLKSTVAGIYENKGVITVPGATDFDLSHYRNPDPTICTDIATTGNSATTGTAGNILSFMNGNISVRASAFSRTNAAPNTWNTAFLGSFSSGLGVTDGSENGANDTHTVDNVGGRDNYVLFEFSQSVLVDRAFLGYVAGDSDITVWIGTKNDPFTNHLTLSDSMLASMGFTEDNTTTLTTARTADINAGGVIGNVLIIAAQTSDTTPEDYFKIASLKVCTPSKTKFFVVNDSTVSGTPDRTYEYTTGGTADENYTLNSANTAPRGAAATAAGDKVWVVDANSKVYVYNKSGGMLGSWTATLPTGAKPEGISTNGTDVWIVTSDGNATGRNTATEKVFRFSGATSGTGASRLSGTQSPVSSFALNSNNKNPKDVVTDGTSLWVVNDAASGDRVFKYNLSGTLLNNWVIDAANTSPTGIAIDPANVSNLWIVDNGTKRIYQYNAAVNLPTSTTARPASTSFALSAGNTNPQGIADPPVWDFSSNAGIQDVKFDSNPEVSSLHNAGSPTDVNADGVTSPLDALLVVNRLNGMASNGSLYQDVNNDGDTSPLDALLVINYLDSMRSKIASNVGTSTSATEQAFAEMGEGEGNAAMDELFADVATQWEKTGGLQQGRRRGIKAK